MTHKQFRNQGTLSHQSAPSIEAKSQTSNRLKSIFAILAAIAVIASAAFVGVREPDGNAGKLLILVAWLGLVALVLLIPKPTLSPRFATFAPIRVAFLTVLTALLTLKASSTAEYVVIGAATIVAMIGIIGEQILRRIGVAGGSVVLNLPGTERLPAVLRMSKSITLGQLASLGLGTLTAVIGFSPLWWLASGLIIIALGMTRAITVIKRRRVNGKIDRQISELVTDYAPDFAIYTARPDDASYQIAMWLPYLKQTGKKFIIITRAEVPSLALAELTDAPIIMRKSIKSLDDLIVPSLTTVFYVNASSGNGAMVRYNQLTHVYLGHGDSDKAPSYNPTHAMYDRVFAAGPAATRRYADHGVIIDQSKFDIVGRPQLEALDVSTSTSATVETVLYAPTWRGHVDETFLHSIPVATNIVAELLERGCRVIFRPHPFSYHFAEDAAIISEVKELLRSHAARSGKQHLWGDAAEKDLDIIGCMNASDAMISDVSSVVSDYLYSTKPFAMVAVNVPISEFSVEYPIARAAYVFDTSLEGLSEVLTAMLGGDPMRLRRKELRADYLGDFPQENYVNAFIDTATKVIEKHTEGEPEIGFEEEAGSKSSDDETSNPDEENESDDISDDELETSDDELAALSRQAAAKRRRFKNALLRLFKQLLPITLASIALVGAAATSVESPWFLVPALITVGFNIYVNRRGFRSLQKMNQALGSMAPARAVIAATLAVGFLAADSEFYAALGATLSFVAIALEGQVSAVWAAAGLQSRNLPGTEQAKPLPFSRGWAGMANMFALIAMLVASALGIRVDAGLAVLLFGSVSLILTSYVLIAGLRRRFINLVLEENLPHLLADVGPKFCVYFGSNIGVSYQLGMWVQYLDRIGVPYIVIARDLKMMRAAAQVTTAPVIYRKTLASLEKMLVPGMTTAFYVNNAVKNTHFIERRELHHVWLNHGDSEKPACFNPVHAIYDEIFTAGQAGIDRYARHNVQIPREKFTIVGRPQVEAIEQSAAHTPITTVLYAPTWRGPYADSAVYSLPQGEQIVAELLERGCRVIFRAHPFNYDFPDARRVMRTIRTMLQEDSLVSGREHIYGAAAEKEMSFVECFNAADAMISDVSAMVSDFLFSLKPFAVVAVRTDEEGLHAAMPATTSGYVIQESLDNYPQVLDKLLGEDPLSSKRETTKNYYLGEFEAGHYADGFLEAARARVLRTAHTLETS